MFRLHASETETEELIELARQEGCRSYLEIGSANGGSLWRVARSLPIGSLVVSVDRPKAKSYEGDLRHCGHQLGARGYRVSLLLGDSADPVIVEKARSLSPFDLLMIDGDHGDRYVRLDYANYGPMARIVAFHDVTPRKEAPHYGVPAFWEELKQGGRRWHEIRHETDGMGIGVIW